MTDHIDTAAERAKLEGLADHRPGPWYAGQPEDAHGWWIVSADPEHYENLDASGDGGFCEPEARLIAAAPDLLATVHRLLDALDAERARAEKAETERDEWKDEYQAAERLLYRYKNAATNRQAERDQALARLAMAYEVAAQDVEEWREEDGETAYDAIAGSIRALTPADAEAALQRVVDAAVRVKIDHIASEEFLRPLIVEQSAGEWSDKMIDEDVSAFSSAIRALKRPEASRE